MRNFQTLDNVFIDEETGVLRLTTEAADTHPIVAMRREGGYIAISASYGPIEIAMRPRLQEFTRVLSRLKPVEGLQTTRQVGTGQSYVALGLQPDGTLIIRLTMVADATGHLTVNLLLTPEVRAALFEWLPVEVDDSSA